MTPPMPSHLTPSRTRQRTPRKPPTPRAASTWATEAALATEAATLLRADGYRVFSEVSIGNRRADIVCTRTVGGKTETIIAEVKLQASLQLLEQLAWHRLRVPHALLAIVPRYPSEAFRTVAAALGVTIWIPHPDAPFITPCKRVKPVDLALIPEAERNTPGTRGGHYTAWQSWTASIQRHVAAHPGCTPADAAAACDIPGKKYSARTVIAYIRSYAHGTSGIAIRSQGRRLTLYMEAGHQLDTKKA